ncbi:hypothetical protein MTR67_002095 [Solanum verrucosum]|uniref:Uncharacterized protein n=1 Tax=Solanum verrucosum TaxID=315347 RepID=A0AAF0TD01_SOLVR|nr:hypothetical protein MTR67_002095 [Solanum verrucosum]
MNLEHPDHILEEVNREELDIPTNIEDDEEETFEEDEWIDEKETSEDDAYYSHLGRGSTIPSSSASQCNTLNTSIGSTGLSNLHLESNGSEPNTPTTQHSNAHGPQPGDKDNFRRLVIEPLGYKWATKNCNNLLPVCSRKPTSGGRYFKEYRPSEVGICRSVFTVFLVVVVHELNRDKTQVTRISIQYAVDRVEHSRVSGEPPCIPKDSVISLS